MSIDPSGPFVGVPPVREAPRPRHPPAGGAAPVDDFAGVAAGAEAAAEEDAERAAANDAVAAALPSGSGQCAPVLGPREEVPGPRERVLDPCE